MNLGRKSLWHRDGSSGMTDSGGLSEVYFITICCIPRGKNQLAHAAVWDTLMETVKTREERGDWKCRLLLTMPDHLHGLFSFSGIAPMAEVIGDLKRWMRHRHAIEWQKKFWDHRLRNAESAIEKANYIRLNPVRAELAATPEEWPYIMDRSKKSESSQ